MDSTKRRKNPEKRKKRTKRNLFSIALNALIRYIIYISIKLSCYLRPSICAKWLHNRYVMPMNGPRKKVHPLGLLRHIQSLARPHKYGSLSFKHSMPRSERYTHAQCVPIIRQTSSTMWAKTSPFLAFQKVALYELSYGNGIFQICWRSCIRLYIHVINNINFSWIYRIFFSITFLLYECVHQAGTCC